MSIYGNSINPSRHLPGLKLMCKCSAAACLQFLGASFERMAATHMGRTPSGHQDPATAAINGTSPEPSSAATAGSQSPVANGATEGPRLCNNNNPVGSSILQEASYSVTYGERGAGVVLVASEPITGSTTDWVSGAGAEETVSWGLLQQVEAMERGLS